MLMDPANTANGVTGGCRCGAVRYTIAADTLPLAYACHCLDCQTWSGSAFSLQSGVRESAFGITGPIVIYELTSPSGRISKQRMCGVCHTRIYNTNSARSGMLMLRAGTLDRSDELNVTFHIWTKRKQAWITIPDGVPSWPESGTPEEFMAALALR
jgi:hypothetical protein